MRYSLLIVLIAFCMLIYCCMDPDSKYLATITIKNNSGDTIGYYYTFKLSIYDTLLPEIKPFIDIKSNSYVLKANSSKICYIEQSGNFPDLQKFMDTYVLIYYFINYDSINTLPWSKIREKNIYMKRVIIDTKQDLENCNFEITYP